MTTNSFQNIMYFAAAGVLLFTGVFMLRFMLRMAWKILRAAMLILMVLFIAGYFLGFLDFLIR